ncbi:Ig-like domain-containing protein [Vibrio astriarenae]
MKAWHWSVALPVVVLTGCNSSSGDNPPPPADELISVSISSKPDDMLVGSTFSLTAQAIWSSGNTEDITDSAQWSVTPENAAKVDGSVLTALAVIDAAQLDLSYQGKIDSASFSISAPDEEVTLEGIELSGFEPSMFVGESQSLTLTAFYSDESEKEVTEVASWSTSDAEFASVEAGLVTGVGAGNVEIRATFDGLSESIFIEVMEVLPELVELEIRNHTPELIDGYSMVLEAWAHYSDESSDNITQEAAWLSSNEDIASFTHNMLQSHKEGEVDVTLSFDGQSATETVTVLPAEAISILPNISSGNTLQITEDDILSNTVVVELSNEKLETYNDAEFVFDDKATDAQGYTLLELGEGSTRALRSGETQFTVGSINESLQKRLGELGIDFELVEDSDIASAIIDLQVTDNPDIYQWNQVIVPDPEGLYLKQMFTQNDRVYFVWNSGSSANNSNGVLLSWFDGQSFSEPVTILDYGFVENSNHMINGGGNGLALITIKTAINTNETHIVDLSNLEQTHRVKFDDYEHLSTIPSMHVQGAVAFDESGNLIVVTKKTMELTFHRYFPETQTWLEAPKILHAERIAQQLTHPNHLMIVQQERSPLDAPISFMFFNLSDFAVETTVPLQYPQDVSEYCETNRGAGYHLGVSLTQDLEKFAVHCYGKVGTSSSPALQRLVWEDATQAPFAYTPEETLSLERSSYQPVVAHIGESILANSDYTKDVYGKEYLNVDRLTEGELILHAQDKPTDSQFFSHAYVEQNTAKNTMLDTSFLAMDNPYVEDEAVFVYQDGIAIFDKELKTLSYDDALYGTKYWGAKGDYMRYLFVLNGEWHMLTHSTRPRQFKVATFQMRNPN